MADTPRSEAVAERAATTRTTAGPAASYRPAAACPAGASALAVAGAVLGDRIARARVTEALRGRARVVFYDDVHALRHALTELHASVLVVECCGRDGAATVDGVRGIREAFPNLPVVAYVIPGRTGSSDILRIAQLGVHELVMQGFDDVGSALRSALESAVRRCGSARVVEAVAPAVPPDVMPFIRYCLDRAADQPSVADAARYLGVHPKTLTYRLKRAHLPAPSTLIGWCRVLLAAQLFESPGRSVAQVALELDFASPAALRGMLRRYTGLRPSELRAHGGLSAALRKFIPAIQAAATANER